MEQSYFSLTLQVIHLSYQVQVGPHPLLQPTRGGAVTYTDGQDIDIPLNSTNLIPIHIPIDSHFQYYIVPTVCDCVCIHDVIVDGVEDREMVRI